MRFLNPCMVLSIALFGLLLNGINAQVGILPILDPAPVRAPAVAPKAAARKATPAPVARVSDAARKATPAPVARVSDAARKPTPAPVANVNDPQANYTTATIKRKGKSHKDDDGIHYKLHHGNPDADHNRAHPRGCGVACGWRGKGK